MRDGLDFAAKSLMGKWNIKGLMGMSKNLRAQQAGYQKNWSGHKSNIDNRFYSGLGLCHGSEMRLFSFSAFLPDFFSQKIYKKENSTG